jgi:hypothetical protein
MSKQGVDDKGRDWQRLCSSEVRLTKGVIEGCCNHFKATVEVMCVTCDVQTLKTTENKVTF